MNHENSQHACRYALLFLPLGGGSWDPSGIPVTKEAAPAEDSLRVFEVSVVVTVVDILPLRRLVRLWFLSFHTF